jgi:hypothetical protein
MCDASLLAHRCMFIASPSSSALFRVEAMFVIRGANFGEPRRITGCQRIYGCATFQDRRSLRHVDTFGFSSWLSAANGDKSRKAVRKPPSDFSPVGTLGCGLFFCWDVRQPPRSGVDASASRHDASWELARAQWELAQAQWEENPLDGGVTDQLVPCAG